VDLRPLARTFYRRDSVAVARDLLGRLLVRQLDGETLVGRIVEAEAYGRDDPASHAFRGQTRRNVSMFGPPGHAYVYVSHGIHHCLNVVARAPSAVLIRAVEPLSGHESMSERRGLEDDRLLCAGPGRLCQALGISLAEDGADLTSGEGIWVGRGRRATDAVATTRVGVTLAADRAWRFVVAGTPYASRRVAAATARARG
jgi:DNA-3-methyladenine glycosylase